MRDTRKFMSKNMGRLSSNVLLSCFIAGVYVYEGLSEEDIATGAGVRMFVSEIPVCTVPHESHLPLK